MIMGFRLDHADENKNELDAIVHIAAVMQS